MSAKTLSRRKLRDSLLSSATAGRPVVTATTVILGGRLLAGTYGPRMGGILAGTQTQPAVLAYANETTKDDPRVNLGYALVYPAAMIVKVIAAPFIGRF